MESADAKPALQKVSADKVEHFQGESPPGPAATELDIARYAKGFTFDIQNVSINDFEDQRVITFGMCSLGEHFTDMFGPEATAEPVYVQLCLPEANYMIFDSPECECLLADVPVAAMLWPELQLPLGPKPGPKQRHQRLKWVGYRPAAKQ